MTHADDTFPLSRQDLQLLAQIGFFAAQSGQRGAAATLFAALRVVRPDAVLPWIGLALADMGAGRAAEAARALRDAALREHPDDPELCAFLGLALIEAGHLAEARKVLQALVDRESAAGNDAQPHVRMASRLLQAEAQGAAPAAARAAAPTGSAHRPSGSESTASSA